MANPEHVAIVRQGAEAIQEWQKKALAKREVVDYESRLDLREADLQHADLRGANLRRARLHKANLFGADLSEAMLRGADFSLAQLAGVDLHDASLIGTNFSCTDLSTTNLRKADLDTADLSWTNLIEARLDGARLAMANLTMANLSRADLHGAHLWGAKLRVANLTQANLQGADLIDADLSGATVIETQLKNSLVGFTVLADLDLSQAKGLEAVEHHTPSFIGIETLSKSRGKIPDEFLRGCGLQPWEVLVAKLSDPALTPRQIKGIQDRIFSERTKGYFLSGVFISYSQQDSQFVDLIYKRLTREGANVWLDRHDLVAGSMQKQVFDAVRLNDVMLLVLSESSLKSDWVENELDMARSKEKEQSRDVLCPVSLDDCWKARIADKESDDRQLWRTLTKKNILDFSGWQSDGFEVPFRKLLDGIKRYYGAAEANS